MQIITLQDLPAALFDRFTAITDGPSVFSQLRSSQTGNERVVTRERLEFIKRSAEHIMLLALEDERLVGMVIGQRITGIGNEYFYIHDIVVDAPFRGHGLGNELIKAIIAAARETWPEVARFQLTSRPSRGTQSFFEKLGFRARTKESGDETIVYVQDVGDYHS